jgi:hypothetical protein
LIADYPIRPEFNHVTSKVVTRHPAAYPLLAFQHKHVFNTTVNQRASAGYAGHACP